MFDTQGGDISIAAVTKCKEICLAVKKGRRRRSRRLLCKLEKEEVTGGLLGLEGLRASQGLKCKTRLTGWRLLLILP